MNICLFLFFVQTQKYTVLENTSFCLKFVSLFVEYHERPYFAMWLGKNWHNKTVQNNVSSIIVLYLYDGTFPILSILAKENALHTLSITVSDQTEIKSTKNTEYPGTGGIKVLYLFDYAILLVGVFPEHCQPHTVMIHCDSADHVTESDSALSIPPCFLARATALHLCEHASLLFLLLVELSSSKPEYITVTCYRKESVEWLSSLNSKNFYFDTMPHQNVFLYKHAQRLLAILPETFIVEYVSCHNILPRFQYRRSLSSEEIQCLDEPEIEALGKMAARWLAGHISKLTNEQAMYFIRYKSTELSDSDKISFLHTRLHAATKNEISVFTARHLNTLLPTQLCNLDIETVLYMDSWVIEGLDIRDIFICNINFRASRNQKKALMVMHPSLFTAEITKIAREKVRKSRSREVVTAYYLLEPCWICSNVLKKYPCVETACKHMFHKKCWRKLAACPRRCPECRRKQHKEPTDVSIIACPKKSILERLLQHK